MSVLGMFYVFSRSGCILLLWIYDGVAVRVYIDESRLHACFINFLHLTFFLNPSVEIWIWLAQDYVHHFIYMTLWQLALFHFFPYHQEFHSFPRAFNRIFVLLPWSYICFAIVAIIAKRTYEVQNNLSVQTMQTSIWTIGLISKIYPSTYFKFITLYSLRFKL